MQLGPKRKSTHTSDRRGRAYMYSQTDIRGGGGVYKPLGESCRGLASNARLSQLNTREMQQTMQSRLIAVVVAYVRSRTRTV